MEMKWIIGIGVLIIVILALVILSPIKEQIRIGGAPALIWLDCGIDSDCIPNMDSFTCCVNKNYTGETGSGPCIIEKYKGYCTCNIPEGWSKGQCNGLKASEPPPINESATPKD